MARVSRWVGVAALAVFSVATADDAAADETWETDFGTLVWEDSFTAHGSHLALLSYPAGSNFPAGFVSLDNLAGNTDARGRSEGFWWSHEPGPFRCEIGFFDAYHNRWTHYYGRLEVDVTAPDWPNSDFQGRYGNCMEAPSLKWNGAHN